MAKRRKGSEPPSDYSQWSAGLTDAHLLCRDLGHNWGAYRATLNAEGSYERVLRCTRCRTERRQTIQRDGAVYGSRYAYADGYLAPKGIGPYNHDARSGLRLASLLRVIGKGE